MDQTQTIREGNTFVFNGENKGKIEVHLAEIHEHEEVSELYLNLSVIPKLGHSVYLEGICFRMRDNWTVKDFEIPRGNGFVITPSTRLDIQLRHVARAIYTEKKRAARQKQKITRPTPSTVSQTELSLKMATLRKQQEQIRKEFT